MLMWFPSNRLYKSVCCVFSLPSSHFPQSCTVLLFALITVSPLLRAAIILSPEKLEELRKKSSIMTVFSFKFRLAVSLETLNNNNNKEWKKTKKPANRLLPKFVSSLWYLFYMLIFTCGWSKKKKKFNNAYCHFAIHYISEEAESSVHLNLFILIFWHSPLNARNIKCLITYIREGRCIFCCSF